MLKEKIYQLLQPGTYIFQNVNKNLRVLAYHTVPVQDLFEKQLEYLIENFNIIDIEMLRNHLLLEKDLPEKSVLITFDDGDISVRDNGFPALKKFNLPAIVFVITGLIDTEDIFWCRRVEAVFKQEGKTYAEARKKVNYLKNVPEKKRKLYLETLPQVKSSQMTYRDLIALKESGVAIGNHTHTHPMINNCTKEEVTEELEMAREKFKQWQLKGYSVFAYPNGNWDERSEQILKQNNIELAFLFDHKVNENKINPMRISRILVDADLAIDEFKAKVTGLHSVLFRIKKKLIFHD